MIKILFIRNQNAFLPEIDAYINFFNKTENFKAYDSSELEKQYEIEDYDVIWEFKGFGGNRPDTAVLVHDYASLSTGKYPKIKNYLKRKLNPKPSLRIFLNEDVRKGFNFNDGVEYVYRDMGINEAFIDSKDPTKEYDFVYIGEVSTARGMDVFLEKFTELNPGTLCMIGSMEDKIYEKYKDNKRIFFTGKIPYLDVPKIAAKGVYGINYIPDKYPYNIQTSTKLLEYLALDLNVVTTDYQWVQDFEKKHQSSFYKINIETLNFNEIDTYNFINGFKAHEYLWDNILKETKIEQKIIDALRKKQ